MTDYERLKDLIKKAAARQNIFTQMEIASLLECDWRYLSAVLNGKSKLSDNFLDKIQNRLNINSEYIRTGSGEQYINESSTAVQQNQSGDNVIHGSTISINPTDASVFLSMLKKKDEQIDRLITLLEKQSDYLNERQTTSDNTIQD